MKPKLLTVELWALGDLVLATPFLRAAAEQFEVTLLAKPTALELQPLLWPGVEVIPFVFPWTAFRGKYALTRWPWRGLFAVKKELQRQQFDWALSARWDPRNNFLLWLTGARRRVGFPRLGSGVFLTDRLHLPPPDAHRYENWRLAARQIGLELPAQSAVVPRLRRGRGAVIHSGAAQPTKVWPLERFAFLAEQLRREGYLVEIVCDKGQKEWWSERGEKPRTPQTLAEFIRLLEDAGLFVGNDSGPGHLAGMMGVPTFTLFGNQFADRFAPLAPASAWMEGADCVYKPCYDSCRFARPECLFAIEQDAAWLKLKSFAAEHLRAPSPVL